MRQVFKKNSIHLAPIALWAARQNTAPLRYRHSEFESLLEDLSRSRPLSLSHSPVSSDLSYHNKSKNAKNKLTKKKILFNVYGMGVLVFSVLVKHNLSKYTHSTGAPWLVPVTGDENHIWPIIRLHGHSSCVCTSDMERGWATTTWALNTCSGQLLYPVTAIYTLLQRERERERMIECTDDKKKCHLNMTKQLCLNMETAVKATFILVLHWCVKRH